MQWAQLGVGAAKQQFLRSLSKNGFFDDRVDPSHMHNRTGVVRPWNGKVLARQRTSSDFLCAFQNSTFSNTARTWRLCTTKWLSPTYAMGRAWSRRREAIIFLVPSKNEFFQRSCGPATYAQRNMRCELMEWGDLKAGTIED